MLPSRAVPRVRRPGRRSAPAHGRTTCQPPRRSTRASRSCGSGSSMGRTPGRACRSCAWSSTSAPSSTLPIEPDPGLPERLLQTLPGLGLHTCGTGRPAASRTGSSEGHVDGPCRGARGARAAAGQPAAGPPAARPGRQGPRGSTTSSSRSTMSGRRPARRDAAVELVNGLITGNRPGHRGRERIVQELRPLPIEAPGHVHPGHRRRRAPTPHPLDAPQRAQPDPARLGRQRRAGSGRR